MKREHDGEFSPCSFKRGHYSDDAASESPAEKNSGMRITQVISITGNSNLNDCLYVFTRFLIYLLYKT